MKSTTRSASPSTPCNASRRTRRPTPPWPSPPNNSGYPDALNAWRIAVNLAPDDLEVATGLARASAARQNYGFAIHVFERLRGYDTALGLQFHVTLAWLLLADGRKNDAAVEARYAAAIAPDDAAVSELVAAIAAA